MNREKTQIANTRERIQLYFTGMDLAIDRAGLLIAQQINIEPYKEDPGLAHRDIAYHKNLASAFYHAAIWHTAQSHGSMPGNTVNARIIKAGEKKLLMEDGIFRPSKITLAHELDTAKRQTAQHKFEDNTIMLALNAHEICMNLGLVSSRHQEKLALKGDDTSCKATTIHQKNSNHGLINSHQNRIKYYETLQFPKTAGPV
jgi:hypothetical protein